MKRHLNIACLLKFVLYNIFMDLIFYPECLQILLVLNSQDIIVWGSEIIIMKTYFLLRSKDF